MQRELIVRGGGGGGGGRAPAEQLYLLSITCKILRVETHIEILKYSIKDL